MKTVTEKMLSKDFNFDERFKYTEHVDLLKKHCRFGYQLLVCVIEQILPKLKLTKTPLVNATQLNPNIILATSITFVNGLQTGHTAGIIRKIKTNETLPFSYTEGDVIMITNVAACSMIFGPVVFTYLINHLGRKKTMFVMFLPLIIHFVAIYFVKTRFHFLFAVFIGNIGSLMSVSAISIYVSEISAPHLRGSFAILIAILFYPGFLIGIVASWLLPLSVTSSFFSIFALIISLFLFYLPESPYFLIRNSKNSNAKIVLNSLYRDEIVSNMEYLRLTRHIKKSMEGPESIRKIYSQRKYWVPIVLLMNLFLLLTFSGSLFFMYYSPVWLSDGKYRYLSPFICQMVLTIMPLPFSLFKTIIFRYVKRKTIGVVSFSINAIALLSMSIFYFLKDTQSSLLDGVYDLFPFVFLVFHRVSLDVGLGSLPYVYFRELIQVEVLAYSSFIVDMLVPVGKAFGMFVFNSLKSHFSYTASFAFCFVWVVVGTVLFLRFTPETKDKFMENVQEEMEEMLDLRVVNKTSLLLDNKNDL